MQIEKWVPEAFDFYGLGHVQESAPTQTWTPTHIYSYSIIGSSQVSSVFILLDAGVDDSMLLELTNVLASRIAGKLSRHEGWKIEISPPRTWDLNKVSTELLHSLLNSKTPTLNFEWLYLNQRIPIRILFYPGAEPHV